MKHSILSTLIMTILSIFSGNVSTNAQTQGDTFRVQGVDYKVTSGETENLAVEVNGGETAISTLTIPATVEYGGLTYSVTSIGDKAFFGSAITSLDLTEAYNLESIGDSAFAENRSLANVQFPSFNLSKLTIIGIHAFLHNFDLQSFNLEDTHIEILQSLFAKDKYDAITISGLKELKLPVTLREIRQCALQCLDITEIEIPSSVSTFEDCVLQGCIYLKEFIWKDAQITSLPIHTFSYIGESLTKVVLLTVEPLEPDGLTDKHFYRIGSSAPPKAVVYVTRESFAILNANGYTNENSIYSMLVAYTEDLSDIEGITTEDKNKNNKPNIESENIYTLQGVKVRETEPGRIYIRNGKKYIAK